MVDWTGGEEYERDLRSYFLCCPICGEDRMTVNFVAGGRDTLHCETCDAKWHVYVGLTGFKWAELELTAKDGKGQGLLGKRFDKNAWKRMAQNTRNIARSVSPLRNSDKVAVEKEIIRQKEIIVKIRCSYCKNTFDETLDKCPHCGAKHT